MSATEVRLPFVSGMHLNKRFKRAARLFAAITSHTTDLRERDR